MLIITFKELIGAEVFLVFSQSIPSRTLGFVDSKTAEVNVTVAGKDFTFHQSPSLLTSNRSEGTTGAGKWILWAVDTDFSINFQIVLWQVTPRFAEWLVNPSNILFSTLLLDKTSHVLELGCGISGLIGLVLAPKVQTYIATDQEYVFKYLRRNISENLAGIDSSIKSRNPKARVATASQPTNNIVIKALDWENDSLSRLYLDLGLDPDNDFISLLISCDCIYNEALVRPFVEACKDICRMAPSSTPTVCIVAQQLRSSDVFESWLKMFHSYFRVWRLSDEHLSSELAENSGFVVHIGVIRGLGGKLDNH
jgi:hypothetical protein